MSFEPLTKEQVAEFAAAAEEEGEKPDPNGLYFSDEIIGGVVPREYIPSVEYGWRQACRKGAKYGFPCVDVLARLEDGKAHDVDSSQQAFETAAVECFKEELADLRVAG